MRKFFLISIIGFSIIACEQLSKSDHELTKFSANIMVWFFPKWYEKKFKNVSKYFPASKGWCLWYLILVLWIGYALLRLGDI